MKSILSGTGFKLIALTFLALPACGPRDVAIEAGGFSANGAGGRAMIVTADKDRASTCPTKSKDFGFLSASADSNAGILSKQVTAFLSAGDRNCFRIGSEVNMQDATKAASADIGAVKVKVIRVEILKVSDVTDAQAAAMGMTLSQFKTFAQSEVDKAVAAGKFDPKGMINLTFFELIDSTVSANLKANLPVAPVTPVTPATPTTPINAIPTPTVANGVTTYTVVGDRPTTCPEKNTDFAYLSNFADNQDKILAGTITAYLSAGDRNCFRVGAEINLQNPTKALTPEMAAQKVKVIRIETLAVASLNQTQATAMGMTLAELQAFAQGEIDKAVAGGKFDPKGMVNITIFELVKVGAPVTAPTTQATPVTPAVAPTTPVNAIPTPTVVDGVTIYSVEGDRSTTCPAKNTDFNFLSNFADNHDKILAGTITGYLSAGDRNCFRVGSIIGLQNPTKALTPEIAALKVKVVRVEILSLANLNAKQAAAMGMTLDELKAFAQAEVDHAVAGGKFDPKGMVNITIFEMADAAPVVPVVSVPTAPATPVSPSTPAAALPTDVILLFGTDGDRASTCPAAAADYSYLSSTPETAPLMSAGEVTALLTVGERNCYRIGAVLPFKDQGDVPDADKFVITAVQIVPVSKLNRTHAAALKMELKALQEYAAREIDNVKAGGKFDPKNTVTITFFQKVVF